MLNDDRGWDVEIANAIAGVMKKATAAGSLDAAAAWRVFDSLNVKSWTTALLYEIQSAHAHAVSAGLVSQSPSGL